MSLGSNSGGASSTSSTPSSADRSVMPDRAHVLTTCSFITFLLTRMQVMPVRAWNMASGPLGLVCPRLSLKGIMGDGDESPTIG